MIYAMVEYVNRNGRLTVKGFSNKESTDAFVKGLKNRNVQYILSVL